MAPQPDGAAGGGKARPAPRKNGGATRPPFIGRPPRRSGASPASSGNLYPSIIAIA